MSVLDRSISAIPFMKKELTGMHEEILLSKAREILELVCDSTDEVMKMRFLGDIVAYLNTDNAQGARLGSFSQRRLDQTLSLYLEEVICAEEVLKNSNKNKLDCKGSPEEKMKSRLQYFRSCSFIDSKKISEETISGLEKLLEDFEKNLKDRIKEKLVKELDLKSGADVGTLTSNLAEFIIEHRNDDFKDKLLRLSPFYEKASGEEIISVQQLIIKGNERGGGILAKALAQIFEIVLKY